MTLNKMILKYGQDLKNNQWIQEPFANMLCSLAIIDTALKRGKKIKDQDKIKEHTELLELSICHHYKEINRNMATILSDICSEEDFEELNKKINMFKEKLSYQPNEILLMKRVVATFYKHEKYYLD